MALAMENAFENTTIMIPLVSLFSQSLNIFHLLLKMISTILLSYWSVLRCFFLLSEDAKVKFETKNPSFQGQGKKQEARFDDETDESCFLLGKEVNMVMERLGIEKHGFLEGEEEKKKWGCGEISRVFEEEEEEVRLEEVREAFGVFDEDRDGFIDAGELQRVLLALGFKQGVELKACGKMIRVFDDNGDGKIDFHEFVKLFAFE